MQSFNTPRGTIRVSTVEATAIDLVGYERHAGGLDQVATVLAELAEHIDPERLVPAAKTAPISWAQRLGYLLELVGAGTAAKSLKEYVREAAKDMTPLLPGTSHEKAEQRNDWRLYVNAEVEAQT
jgi:predicted transcriptional regulator of viral defense system